MPSKRVKRTPSKKPTTSSSGRAKLVEYAQLAERRRRRHINNVLAILAEYEAAGVELDYTIERLLARLDWCAMDPRAISEGLRLMLESTTVLELRDISNEADNERELLRNHLAELEREDAAQRAHNPGIDRAELEGIKQQAYRDVRDAQPRVVRP